MKRLSSGKSECNVSDICLLMHRIPPDKFPTIVTANLVKIPVLDPDVIDLSVVSQQVNDIKIGMLEVNVLQSRRKERTEIKRQLSGFQFTEKR